MAFPAIQTAGLVTSSNVVAKSAAYTANNGDIVLVTTGSTAGLTITLPPVAQGGPVVVRKVDAAGTGTVKVVTSDSSQINGGSGATGITGSASALGGWTFVSDGTNWWTISIG